MTAAVAHPMDSTTVLQWELHAPGSQVLFSAHRHDNGYDVVVWKDNQVLLADVAPDGESLFRKSQELRAHLLRLGYSPKRAAVCEPQLEAGPCWGPARSLESSVLQVLRADG